MPISFAGTAHAVMVLASILLLAGVARADEYERPPSFAGKIAGVRLSGPGYAIRSPVRSDGLFRNYVLVTGQGLFRVQGDLMLRMRLAELAAFHRLERLGHSEQFAAALLKAGINPVKYAGKLILNPAETLQDTFAGVGSFLDSLGAEAAQAGRTRDDPVGSMIGTSRERRLLAAQLGVDPYTDFPPLAAKLQLLAEAAAIGGLAVSGAMLAVPGAAGVVVTNLSTANMLGDMRIDEIARKLTAAQILELNAKRLAAMGIGEGLVGDFLGNRHYTPLDQAAVVAALESMRGVADKGVFVRRAATASSRGNAFTMRKHAEMAAAHHARNGAFARFVSLGGLTFAVTRDGTAIGLMPADMVSWTEPVARAMTASSADLKRAANAGELRIAGQATPLARNRLQALGWQLAENVRF